MATHSSVLAWRIPGMGEPGGLPSTGLHRVGHYWSDFNSKIFERQGTIFCSLFLYFAYLNFIYLSPSSEETITQPFLGCYCCYSYYYYGVDPWIKWVYTVGVHLYADFFQWQILWYCTVCICLNQWHPTPVLLPGKSMDGGAWWAAVHGVAKSRTQLSDFTFTFHFDAMEKEMATHSSVLAWRIPGTEEPNGLLSVGLHRVGHDWAT